MLSCHLKGSRAPAAYENNTSLAIIKKNTKGNQTYDLVVFMIDLYCCSVLC